MNIELRTIAKQNKVSLPDLLTRPVGRTFYGAARKKISRAGQGETVVCDFEGVQVIDPSFVDEFVIMLLKNATEGANDYYVRVKNVSKSAELNIRSVMDSYRTYGERRFALLTEDLTSENTHVIGDLSSGEKDIIELLRINKSVTVPVVSHSLNVGESESREMLDQLINLRIVKANGNGFTLV